MPHLLTPFYERVSGSNDFFLKWMYMASVAPGVINVGFRLSILWEKKKVSRHVRFRQNHWRQSFKAFPSLEKEVNMATVTSLLSGFLPSPNLELITYVVWGIYASLRWSGKLVWFRWIENLHRLVTSLMKFFLETMILTLVTTDSWIAFYIQMNVQRLIQGSPCLAWTLLSVTSIEILYAHDGLRYLRIFYDY